MVMLGVTGLLALVTLLVPVAARANVAFSLVLAAAGIALGVLIDQIPLLRLGGGPIEDFFGALGHFDLSSEAFILVFLPVLLFETAIAIDVRRLVDDVAPILLLAVVAVLLSTFIVGFSLAAVTDMGVIACLLLAAIVSTTDPIAVVGIFRDLGVPHRLSLLVEGESLFNDAAAISLFALFVGMMTGERQADVLTGVLAFARGFAGGLLFGYVCGRLVCWSFILLRGQPAAEITLTVAAAYLVFLLGEHYLHVSGVVAVVTTALVISYEGRTRVSAETWTSLIDVWRQVGYWASCLIFLLATMRVPEMLGSMTGGDILALAVLIGSALLARALVLFGLFPGLAALGWAEPISVPLRAVVLWGGLRGAISLALALAVVENPHIPASVKSFVSVMCTGFVLFTLFVNAPLLRPLIHLFGLDRLSPSDMTVRGRAIAAALAMVRHRVTDAAADYGIDHASAVALADSYTGRLSAAELEMGRAVPPTIAEDIRSGLMMLAAREHGIYLRHYRDGKISGRITRTLLACAARLQDGVKIDGAAGYDAASAGILAFSRKFRLALALHRHFGLEGVLADQIANRFEVLLMLQAAIRELSDFAANKLPLMVAEDAVARITATIAVRMEAVDTALAALRLQYSDFSQALRLQYLERAAIRIEEAEYARLRVEAVIGHEVYSNLMAELGMRKQRLARRPAMDLQLSPRKLVERVPLFKTLSPDQLSRIIDLLHPMLVVPGDFIIRKGEVGDGMFFVASGAVEVRTETNRLRLGSGGFFGEMALLSHAPRNADVVALGFCSLLVLHARDFSALLNTSTEIRDCIHETSRRRAGNPSTAAKEVEVVLAPT
ncbi:MAG: monovalent cation:H+ antiporter, CPA1 family [Stygiobacter sp.]|nr:MAG: monovalent cation:H+ antiporter, CPA1 family [Stygiobacter sp.]